MAALEARDPRGGRRRPLGPGNYALGRGHLALGRRGRGARAPGGRLARAASASPAWPMRWPWCSGHLYQRAAPGGRAPAEPRAARGPPAASSSARYRDPALAWLRQSEGADVPSTEYVAALLAFYEDRFDEALSRLDALGNRLPWFHEAPLLRGDILQARAARRWNQGDREGALADFEAGRQAYAAAAAIGESVPAVYQALAKLEYTAMLMELYGQGDVLPPLTRGLEAVAQALADARPRTPPRWCWRRASTAGWPSTTSPRRDDPRTDPCGAGGGAQRARQGPHRHADAPGAGANPLPVRPVPREPGPGSQRAVPPGRAGAAADHHLRDRDYDFHDTLGPSSPSGRATRTTSAPAPSEHRRQAIESLQEATQLSPRIPEAWSNLGMAYYRRAERPLPALRSGRSWRSGGGSPAGLAALQQAMELNPEQLGALLYGGLSQAQWAALHPCSPESSALAEHRAGALPQGAGHHPEPAGLSTTAWAWCCSARRSGRGSGAKTPSRCSTRPRPRFEQAIHLAPGSPSATPTSARRIVARHYQEREDKDPPRACAPPWPRWSRPIAGRRTRGLPGGPGPEPGMLAESEAGRAGIRVRSFSARSRCCGGARAQPPARRAWLALGKVQGLRPAGDPPGTGRKEEFQQTAERASRGTRAGYRVLGAPARLRLAASGLGAHEKDAGRAPAPQLERGLALMEEALSMCPECRALYASSKLRRFGGHLEVRPDEQQACGSGQGGLLPSTSKEPPPAPGIETAARGFGGNPGATTPRTTDVAVLLPPPPSW